MNWKQTVSFLRAEAPPLLPVRCYLRRLARSDDALGWTELRECNGKPHHFVIAVHNGAPFSYLRIILVHEWAHCLAWQEGHTTVEDHGLEWALAFSRLYQLLVEP